MVVWALSTLALMGLSLLLLVEVAVYVIDRLGSTS
jgi:hypothetical protein